MKTLIELYDERAIENVIAPHLFRPEEVIYLCPEEITAAHTFENTLRSFFASQGLSFRLRFETASQYRADRVYAQLCKITETRPDCVLDVTGGTDAVLFAAGMLCQEKGTPAFTYSRKRNRFYNIHAAPFADDLPCTLEYSVADFFAMAGGKLQKGRVDNRLLAHYLPSFQPFFDTYLQFRQNWTDAITFFQRISQNGQESGSLLAEGSRWQKGERGSKVTAEPALLQKLVRIGFLQDLRIGEENVSFRFADEQIRAWLRDVGSVLELYVYHECVRADIFNDVVSSAIVDWDGEDGNRVVSNEIDAVASRGIIPVFISCKACDVKTEALNELAVLRDRFGGKGAKAVIVTTETVTAAARHRAAQLNIAVIDLEELSSGMTAERLKVIMKVKEMPGEPDLRD